MGVLPHRHIHAKAWCSCLQIKTHGAGSHRIGSLRHLGRRPQTHDSLEAPRHYLDFDDVLEALPEPSRTELLDEVADYEPC